MTGAVELERRLEALIGLGFLQDAADKIFVAVPLPPIAEKVDFTKAVEQALKSSPNGISPPDLRAVLALYRYRPEPARRLARALALSETTERRLTGGSTDPTGAHGGERR